MEKTSGNLKKIVLTGGHAATTALATIEELKKSESPLWQIFWIGSKKAIEGKSLTTIEYKIFPELGVYYYPIISGRLQRRFTRYSLPSLLKIPIGFFHALLTLLRVRPNVILSFGGFAAFPVVVSGFFLRIPVVVHEQTSAVGLANKLSSFFAKRVAIAREGSAKFFPRAKTVLVGNPVMSSIVSLPKKRTLKEPPTLYITGGSRGAQRVNRVVGEILSRLLSRFKVIHHTGELDYEKFKAIKNGLPEDLGKKYAVFDFIHPLKIARVYEKADIVIARAGANTVSEIMVVGMPAVLIPIPWTRYNEQLENAKLAEKEGVAVVLEEKDLNSEKFLKTIDNLRENWEGRASAASRYAKLDSQASKKLAKLVSDAVNY